MAKGCEWPTGCEADGVPESVPVYHLEWEGKIVGDYCRVHARKRVRQLGQEARRAVPAHGAGGEGEAGQ